MVATIVSLTTIHANHQPYSLTHGLLVVPVNHQGLDHCHLTIRIVDLLSAAQAVLALLLVRLVDGLRGSETHRYVDRCFMWALWMVED